jgi:hypothetical protein
MVVHQAGVRHVGEGRWTAAAAAAASKQAVEAVDKGGARHRKGAVQQGRRRQRRQRVARGWRGRSVASERCHSPTAPCYTYSCSRIERGAVGACRQLVSEYERGEVCGAAACREVQLRAQSDKGGAQQRSLQLQHRERSPRYDQQFAQRTGRSCSTADWRLRPAPPRPPGQADVGERSTTRVQSPTPGARQSGRERSGRGARGGPDPPCTETRTPDGRRERSRDAETGDGRARARRGRARGTRGHRRCVRRDAPCRDRGLSPFEQRRAGVRFAL